MNGQTSIGFFYRRCMYNLSTARLILLLVTPFLLQGRLWELNLENEKCLTVK